MAAAAPPPLLTFASREAFEAWLEEQPENSPGAWLRFSKKGAAEATLAKTDAIDCALAYGWIDGQLGRIDDQHFKTRFTPRRPRSPWSEVNRGRVERLIQDGRMTPRGMMEVARAKADGRWDAAYAPQSQARPGPELEAALNASPGARALFEALDAANRFAVIYRAQEARTPEGRAAKTAALIAMLERGETVHERRRRRKAAPPHEDRS